MMCNVFFSELSTHSFQQCSACKTVRRIALMRRLRLKNKARRPVLNTLKKRLQHAVRTLRRRSKKVQVLCSNLERLKEKNSAIEASVLEKKVLPVLSACLSIRDTLPNGISSFSRSVSFPRNSRMLCEPAFKPPNDGPSVGSNTVRNGFLSALFFE